MRLYIERDHYAATCNMAVRREIFARSGPSPASASPRTWTGAGAPPRWATATAYVPAMRVRTPARRDFAELARKWDRHLAHFYAENRARAAGGPAARLRWLGRAALVAASPLGEVPTLARTDRLSPAGDRGRGLLGVTRLRLYRAGRMLRLALGADPARLAGGWREP